MPELVRPQTFSPDLMALISALGQSLVPEYLKSKPQLFDTPTTPGKMPAVENDPGATAAFGGIDLAGNLPQAMFVGPLGMAAKAMATAKPTASMVKTAGGWASDKLKTMTPEEAFSVYGIMKGLEGKPRMELRDTGAELVPAGPLVGDTQEFKLQHPKLDFHEVYGIPPIKFIQPEPGMPSGTQQGGQITIAKHPKVATGEIESIGTDPVSIALHEMQHAVQEKEGFTKGTNPMASPYAGKFWEALGQPPETAKDFETSNLMHDLIKALKVKGTTSPEMDAAFDVYRTAAGEVEARNVQQRHALPALYNYHPNQTTDVPLEKQHLVEETYKGLPGMESAASDVVTALGKPLTDPPQHLQDAATAYAQGALTAKDLQKIFKKEGWSVDLRRGNYELESFDPSGKQHYIAP